MNYWLEQLSYQDLFGTTSGCWFGMIAEAGKTRTCLPSTACLASHLSSMLSH